MTLIQAWGDSLSLLKLKHLKLFLLVTLKSIIYSFYFFFFFYSSKTIEYFFISFFRTIKMFIYNLPLLIIIAFVPLYLPLEVLRHINISSLLTPGITLFHISAVLDIIRTLY